MQEYEKAIQKLEEEKLELGKTSALKTRRLKPTRSRASPPPYAETATSLLESTKDIHLNSVMSKKKKSFSDLVRLLKKGTKLKEVTIHN